MTKFKDSIRVDKWLWYARFFKHRTTTAKIISQGKVRLNGKRIMKPSMALRKGDGLTFRQGDILRVVRVLDLGYRRGPAVEAELLYDEIKEAIAVKEVVYSEKILTNQSSSGKFSKPDKRQRRDSINLKKLYLVDC